MINNKVAKNAFWIIGVKVVQTLLTLAVTMFMARYLGPSNYGIINYAAAVVAFFSPFALLGLNEVMVQELVTSPEREGEVVGTAMTLSVISSFVCMLGTASFALLVNSGEKEVIIVCILYSILLVFQSMELIIYWFQAKLISKYSSIAALIAYFAASGYKIALLVLGKNIYWFAVSNALEHMLLALAMIAVYRKLGGLPFSFSLNTAKKLLARSCYYILPNMMVVIFGQTDRIMLKLLLDESATGFYAAAFTCAGIGGFVLTAIADSMRPSVFEGKAVSEELFEKRMKQLYCLMIYISVSKNLVVTVFASPIMRLVYGPEFMAAVPTLQWICWYITFSEIGLVRNIWILAQGQQKWLLLINAAGATFNVLLNLILIPVLGTVGAAVATVATEFVANVIVSCAIRPVRHSTKLMLESLDIRILFDMAGSLRKT